MACDSAITSNDVVISKQIKIRRTTAGCLFGSAGKGDERAFEALVDPIDRPEQLPDVEALTQGAAELDGLLVFPDGRIFLVCVRPCKDADTAGVIEIIGFDGYAIGSGGDMARAAMMAGASAVRAVEIVAEVDTASRPPVHQLDFKK